MNNYLMIEQFSLKNENELEGLERIGLINWKTIISTFGGEPFKGVSHEFRWFCC